MFYQVFFSFTDFIFFIFFVRFFYFRLSFMDCILFILHFKGHAFFKTSKKALALNAIIIVVAIGIILMLLLLLLTNKRVANIQQTNRNVSSLQTPVENLTNK